MVLGGGWAARDEMLGLEEMLEEICSLLEDMLSHRGDDLYLLEEMFSRRCSARGDVLS